MISRKQYLQKLIDLKDERVVKVISGVRRSGKTTLLRMYQAHLRESGVGDEQMVYIDFEDVQFENLLDQSNLNEYISARLQAGRRTYIFYDEAQGVPQLNLFDVGLYDQHDVDIYIAGSQAGISSNIPEGKHIEINILPLSFAEFTETRDSIFSTLRAFADFYRNGAFPQTAVIAEEELRAELIRGLYNTILFKDVMARNKINDADLLERLACLLLDNIGNVLSAKKIADMLTASGKKTTSITVESYINALLDAYVFYKAPRHDIKAGQDLKSLEKYYVADVSLHHLVFGNRDQDISRVLENIVYLELVRRGYEVKVGKIGGAEVDFVAVRGDQRVYLQVAVGENDPQVFEREVAILRKIKDHFPKYLLSMNDIRTGRDGIRHMNIVDFLVVENQW